MLRLSRPIYNSKQLEALSPGMVIWIEDRSGAIIQSRTRHMLRLGRVEKKDLYVHGFVAPLPALYFYPRAGTRVVTTHRLDDIPLEEFYRYLDVSDVRGPFVLEEKAGVRVPLNNVTVCEVIVGDAPHEGIKDG